MVCIIIFFFRRKTAYEMRISDWSSVVCSSDLTGPMEGVFLEVVPGEKVVTTDAYASGWIPQTPFMTAIWSFADEGEGTRFTATARHWDAEAMERHKEMGFHPGWDQMAEQFKTLCEASTASA